MSIWVIITTSLINESIKGRDYETRKSEYYAGIEKIKKHFEGCNLVIIENNSLLQKKLKVATHKTFLDNFNIPVLYTKNNRFITLNYGIKELLDVFACIQHFNIPDNDFIIKITGRYMLTEDSNFVKEVKKLSETKYDAIVRYGSYENNPAPMKSPHCVTGLVGLRCKYVKQIEVPDEHTYVEEKWATQISSLDESKVCVLSSLGVYVRPTSQEYYFLI